MVGSFLFNVPQSRGPTNRPVHQVYDPAKPQASTLAVSRAATSAVPTPKDPHLRRAATFGKIVTVCHAPAPMREKSRDRGGFQPFACVVGMWCSKCKQDVFPAASTNE